ncbi:MAG: pimeloyl-CoA dehydrogenase small subunit [Rhodospirillaceae bacterium]|nr:pimeloyl-CoA dehydrogenase small subunit [Rhodospirillaceae bacterium]
MLGFETTDEERLLRESVERFIERDYPISQRLTAACSDLGYSKEIWARFAELGWLGLTIPESYGGFGAGSRETAILMEGFGGGLVIEPYLSCITMAADAISLSGNESICKDWLPAISSGERFVSLAYLERQSRYDVNHVVTVATPHENGFKLTGEKSLVFNGDSADAFVVSARTSGAPYDKDGISLFLVPADCLGVSVRGYATHDGSRAAEISLEGVSLDDTSLLGVQGQAYATLARVIDRATAAICAEAVGIMRVLYETTLAYSKTREQFGQPIGKFQVIQHRLVDMFVALEECRSLNSVYMADVDSANEVERQQAVSAIKAQIGKAGTLVGREAIQLHGGIAMTDDYVAGHYFKRLTVITRLFGDLEWHLDRIADLAG